MKIGLFINPCKNLFQNGCFQQSYFILKALQKANTTVNLYSVIKEQSTFQLTNTTIYPVRSIEDVKDLDIMLFVSGILQDNYFLKEMKQNGTRLVHVICGNWICLFQEEWTHNLHNRAKKAFNSEIEEYWLLPMYKFMIPFISTITHKDVYIAPYVWDEEIIQTRCLSGQFNIEYPENKNIEDGTRILIMEPNVSVHKTGLVPLLICERLYVEMKYKNIKVFIFCQKKHQGFNDIINRLKLFQDKKIELYNRMETPSVLSQLSKKPGKLVVVSHQISNILNFLHLEMYYYGYPIVHNCPPYESMGYYYQGDDIIAGAEQLNYAVKYHSNNLDMYRDKGKKLLYQYHFTNPDVYLTWKKMCVEAICRKRIK